MTTQGGRQRSSVPKYLGAEEALSQISKEAETRLTARRAARAEAKEIRHREIEKKKKEQELKEGEGDGGMSESSTEIKVNDQHGTGSSTSVILPQPFQDDVLDGTLLLLDKNRDFKKELKELQEKYKAAMMTIAQLDNEKVAMTFSIDRLTEEVGDHEETNLELQRQLKTKTRDLEFSKRDSKECAHQLAQLKEVLEYQEKLLHDSGLMVVQDAEGKMVMECTSILSSPVTGCVLLSADTLALLEEEEGSLDTKLKTLALGKLKYEEEIRKLQQQLEELQHSSRDDSGPKQPTANGTDLQLYEIQEEASKTIHEYKLKLQKSEQKIAALEHSVSKNTDQLKVLQNAAEEWEKRFEEARTERRRLQRALRDAESKEADLKSQNEHLTKRLERIKQTRLALAASDASLFADHEWMKATEDS